MISQGLEDYQVAIVEGVQLFTLHIQHTDGGGLRLQGHAHLRASPDGLRCGDVSRLLVYVTSEDRLSRASHPAHDPFLGHFEARWLEAGIIPGGTSPSLRHHVIILVKANSHQVVPKRISDQVNDPLQQFVNIQDGGHTAADLADDAELLGTPLLSLEEPGVLQSHGRLVGQ